MEKIHIFTICISLFPWCANSQGVKKMTPEVYGMWNKITHVQLSDSANTVIYTLEKEVGDKVLCAYDAIEDTTIRLDRVVKSKLDPSGRFVIYTHGLNVDSLKTLRRKKTPKDKIPEDSLTIFDLDQLNRRTYAKVNDFKATEKYTGYCFYLQSTPKIPQDSTENKSKSKPAKCENKQLVIHHLFENTVDTIPYVKDFTFAEEKEVIAYVQCVMDSVITYQVWIYDLKTSTKTIVIEGLVEVDQLSLDKMGSQLAFLGLKSKSTAAQKPYVLFFKTKTSNTAKIIPLDSIPNLTGNYVVSPDKKPTFSPSGQRLLWGMAPLWPIKDTTLLDEEVVQVEIWMHDAPKLYTQLEANVDKEKKKSYTVMMNVDALKPMALESPLFQKSILAKEGDGKYVLQLNATPYEKEVTWTGETLHDFSLLDTETGQSSLISTQVSGSPKFSPEGKYVYWWSKNDSIWKTFDTQNGIVSILGLWSITKFHDEKNDVPQAAGPYGIAGWLKNDEAILVYDRYDIYKLFPKDALNYDKLTNGRENKTVFRYISTELDQKYIDEDKIHMLHGFNEYSKSTSYHYINFKTKTISVLVEGPFALALKPTKALKTDHFIFTKEHFSLFPDLLLADSSFSVVRTISNANPQQSEYAWGSAAPFTWTNFRNIKNEGMIFLPPHFDPEKKYPLIVNFYERSSDDLHKHRAPEAHRSTINYTYYTNNGYVIFNPDIYYTTGQPGEDCFNAVESGVEALVKQGYINENKIALQGHSWGGYQVAYLLTKSSRYSCAEAGAPVVNMVSAYGGIRWESGLSRMFQYEKSQSRLGASLWENASLFHKNSPIYEMDKVQTPILIMHNDEDGAVPWYQSIEYYMALRRLNKPAWLLNYNGEPHWPVKWQNRLDFNIRMEQFFNHYLLGGPKPQWMLEGNHPLEKGILNKY